MCHSEDSPETAGAENRAGHREELESIRGGLVRLIASGARGDAYAPLLDRLDILIRSM
jgi:hypothetical protein